MAMEPKRERSGRGPLKLLLFSCNVVPIDLVASERWYVWKHPSRWFDAKFNHVKPMSPRENGTVPVNWLRPKSSASITTFVLNAKEGNLGPSRLSEMAT